ncbi:MAG: site-specific integrase, partial [Chloroflexota bacterium]|nr:site-specific integrase [Chloroflexota bacterium]
MEELLDSYIYYLKVERDFSPFTLRNYSSDILGFFNFLKMEQIESLKDVDHDTIRLYLGQILESGLARTSISRKVSSLRSFFRYLYFQGVIGLDPLVKLSAPKREKRLPSFLTAEDMINLLNAPKKTTPHGLRDLAILELLYASGLRISEIASLDLQNVDLTTKQVRVMGKGSKER